MAFKSISQPCSVDWSTTKTWNLPQMFKEWILASKKTCCNCFT